MQYKVIGAPLSVVICEVDSDEMVLTERESMCWMSPNMKPSASNNGGLGGVLGRMFAGESASQSRYTAQGGPGEIAFSTSFPGSIRALDITPDHPVIVQKGNFLASENGVESSVFFQKKWSSSLFGGEDFVMQKLSGTGTAFVEIDGSASEYQLEDGESMVVSADSLSMMDATCSVELVPPSRSKSVRFGDTGAINTVVHGPGRVILQSAPATAEDRTEELLAAGK